MNSPTRVPSNYIGREQALIKHRLLESYLERLLLIIGMGAGRHSGLPMELCYVDCFAGPWGDPSENLEGTSIAVSLKTMAACRTTLARMGVQANMRALFIERDKTAFQRLQAYLAQSCPDNVCAECWCGDFVDFRSRILEWCGRHAFTFFFIDPTGWKDVGVPILRPLLARPGSEFLINFMYDFINRAASAEEFKLHVANFLGSNVESLEQLDGLPPQAREEGLVQAYRKGLATSLAQERVMTTRQARTAYVRIMDPKRFRPKYHLVYVSTHPKGIVKFMEISENLELVQKQVRAADFNARREEKTGTADLFGEDSYTQAAPAPHGVDPSHVDALWIQYLTETPRRIGEEQMAELFEATGWMPGDFQASLARLIRDGYVRNLDAVKARPKKPLHYDHQGERLQMVPLDEFKPT